jgi:hypothetical protein
MVVLLAFVIPILPAMSAVAPEPAAAAGEEWYGTVEWSAVGSRTLLNNSVYSSDETYTLTLPESGTIGTIDGMIRSSIVHPDPVPDAENCWLRRESWTGAVIDLPTGDLSVVSLGNQYYQLDVLPAASTSGVYETKWGGGVVDEQPCSRFDGRDLFEITPWVRVYSNSNTMPAYRSGKNATPDRTYIGGCLSYGYKKGCTEGYNAGNWVPSFRSQWSIAAKECTGYSRSYRLGDGDTLLVFNPCQTQSLSSRINYLDEITGAPKICDYAFAKRASRVCLGYKAVNRTNWLRNDWFFFNAAKNRECGVWVLDGASWRDPKIKPASRASDGLAVTGINPGGSVRVRTAGGGSLTVSCP